MKIKFKVDPADLFRRGIDAVTPIVSLDLNPATLPGDQRELIAKHLLIAEDGCNVVHDPQRAIPGEVALPGHHPGASLVEAKIPTLESLLEALTELESQAGTHPIGPELFAQNLRI